MWSLEAPGSPWPAQAQTPNGKGAEVAGRGCGGFWQEKTLQKKKRVCKGAVIAASPTHVDRRLKLSLKTLSRSVTPMQKVCFINSNQQSSY